jgi:hypothetical protein
MKSGRTTRWLIITLVSFILLAPIFFVLWSGAWNRASILCSTSTEPPGTMMWSFEWTWTPPGWTCRYWGPNERVIGERRIDVWEMIRGREGA